MARNRDRQRSEEEWRREPPPFPLGGMRSDGWGGNLDWRRFPGEEGWYGEGYDGLPGIAYDAMYGGGATYYPFERRSSFDSRHDPGLQPRGYAGRWEAEYDRYDYGPAPEVPFGFRRRPDWGRVSGYNDPENVRALDLMTERPEVVTPGSSVMDAARKMRDLDVGILPVVESLEGRRLRGVITDRDIALRAIANGKDGRERVSECMTTEVRTVNVNDSIHEVMRVMRDELVRRVPVVDREGRLVGIVSQADLAVDYAARDFEKEGEVAETIERISEPARPKRNSE